MMTNNAWWLNDQDSGFKTYVEKQREEQRDLYLEHLLMWGEPDYCGVEDNFFDLVNGEPLTQEQTKKYFRSYVSAKRQELDAMGDEFDNRIQRRRLQLTCCPPKRL
jgi:hypothetical protein